MLRTKQNYITYNWEPLPIVETMKPWLHYLLRVNQKVLVQCDHENIKFFERSKVLSWRQT